MDDNFLFDFSLDSEINLDLVDYYLSFPPVYPTTMQEDLAVVPNDGSQSAEPTQSPKRLSTPLIPGIGGASSSTESVKDPIDGIIYNTPEDNFAADLKRGTELKDTLAVNIKVEGDTAVDSAQTGQPSSGSASVNLSYKETDNVAYIMQPTRTSSPYNPRTNTPINTPIPSQAGPADLRGYQFKLMPPQRASLAAVNEPVVSISKPLMRSQAPNQPGTSRQGQTTGTQSTISRLNVPHTATMPPLIQQSRSLPQNVPPSANPTVSVRPPTPPFSAPPSPVNAAFNSGPGGGGMQYHNMGFPPSSMKTNAQLSQIQSSYGWNGLSPFNPVGTSNNVGTSTQFARGISTGHQSLLSSDLKPPAAIQQYRSAPATPMPPQYAMAGPISSVSTPGSMAMQAANQLVYQNVQPMVMQRAQSNIGPFSQKLQNHTGNVMPQTFNTHVQAGAAPHQFVDGSIRERRGAQVISPQQDVKPSYPWDNQPQQRAQQSYPQNSNGPYGVPRLGAGVAYPPQNYRQQIPPNQFYNPNVAGNPPHINAVPPNPTIKRENSSSFFDHVQLHNQNQRAQLAGNGRGMKVEAKAELGEGVLLSGMGVPTMQPMEKTRFVVNSTAEDFQGGAGSSRLAYRARVGQGQKRKRESENGDGVGSNVRKPRKRKVKVKEVVILDDDSDQEADEATAEGDVYIQCTWPRSDGRACGKLLWVLGPGTVRKSSSIRRHLQECKYHDDVQFGQATIICRFGGNACRGTTMNLDNIDRHITKTIYHSDGFVLWKQNGYDPQGGRLFRTMTVDECAAWEGLTKEQRAREVVQKERTRIIKDAARPHI